MLRRASRFELSGTILDSQGAPASTRFVLVRGGSSSVANTGFTGVGFTGVPITPTASDSNGRFRFPAVEAGSYRLIAERLGRDPADIIFLSDVVQELDAAREAGMRTVLLDRREDYPQPRTGDAANGHLRVESFADIAA